MKTLDAARLAELAMNVLEKTAMLLAQPAEGDPSDGHTIDHFAAIRFAGPVSGTLVLGADSEFLLELAAGLLGVEASEVNLASQGKDALRELANMVGGCVVTELSGASDHTLGLPQLVDQGPDAPAGAVTCGLIAENGVLTATVIPA